MQRRRFIQQILASLPALWMGHGMLSSCGDDDARPNGKSVIIIGAGIAGLAAAVKLKAKGFVVTVLEARDKAGGRICTDRSQALPFDMGASWIHGPNRNPISDLAAKAGASTFRTNDDSVRVYDTNGAAYSDQTLTQTERAYEDALQAVQRAGATDKSFAQVFQTLHPDRLSDRLWKYLLSAYLEFDTSADITQLGSLYFDDDEMFSGADVIITNGYDRIIEHLARGLNIQLNTPVTAVQYDGSTGVQVRTATETLHADYVVAAVPLGVLQQERIAFNPALPATMRTSLNNLRMGNVNKFLLEWDAPFWETHLQYIGFTPEVKGKFNYFLNLKKFSSANALMTFALGQYAYDTEQMTDAQLSQEITAHLRSIYGNSAPEPTRLRRTRWSQEPHIGGAYTFVPNGGRSADLDAVAQPLNNRIFFAGEHTHRDYRGTVHGAYLSGVREADRIIDLL